MHKVFSGIQPTGIMHLGNYLGAVQTWVELQKDNECIFCLVDLHAITVHQDPDVLRAQTRVNAALLLACGIKPDDKTILFAQSNVSTHARLAWIFNCVARTGWLDRMTQFKDKGGDNTENVSTGLYVYPNLMAADICAYGATHVPVGNDQKQHLELANDIIQKFNHDYKVDFFSRISPIMMPETGRIMSLRVSTNKMSKSDPSDQSRINMMDAADAIHLKIRKATTDQFPLPASLGEFEARPAIANLYRIYSGVTGISLDNVVALYAGKQTSVFKADLTEYLVDLIEPICNEAGRILSEDHVDKILKVGAEQAYDISHPIVREVEKIVGFYI